MTNNRVKIRVEKGPPTIVNAVGELDFENCDELDSVLSDVLGGCSRKISLDLGELGFVDSSGLRVLVRAAITANAGGHTLGITSLSPQLAHLLSTSGCRHLFRITASLEDNRKQYHSKRLSCSAYSCVISANMSSCRDARNAVCRFAESIGFSLTAQDDLRLAVGEAVSNAIRHGNGGSGTITVRCRTVGGNLLVSLEYQSTAFDPCAIPKPELDLNCEGGMGIHFMRLVMDDVSYNFCDGTAVLTLTKRMDGHTDETVEVRRENRNPFAVIVLSGIIHELA
jgi:serine/threonine-protein kinase RsbW